MEMKYLVLSCFVSAFYIGALVVFCKVITPLEEAIKLPWKESLGKLALGLYFTVSGWYLVLAGNTALMSLGNRMGLKIGDLPHVSLVICSAFGGGDMLALKSGGGVLIVSALVLVLASYLIVRAWKSRTTR